jgi:phage FluMu protein Com
MGGYRDILLEEEKINSHPPLDTMMIRCKHENLEIHEVSFRDLRYKSWKCPTCNVVNNDTALRQLEHTRQAYQ